MELLSLKYYTMFLAINLLFIIFILRACYFIFIIKSDPIKSIIPQTKFAKNILKRLEESRNSKERNKFS